MVSGAISDSDTYVGGPWFVLFRSVVRTASVRGSYGFGPWFVRGRYDFGSYFDLTRSTDHPPLVKSEGWEDKQRAVKSEGEGHYLI